jgi:hypothetical protein
MNLHHVCDYFLINYTHIAYIRVPVFVVRPHSRFHIPGYNSPFVTVGKLKAKFKNSHSRHVIVLHSIIGSLDRTRILFNDAFLFLGVYVRVQLRGPTSNYHLSQQISSCIRHVVIADHTKLKKRGSSLSTVSDYGLDGRGSIPDRGRGFSPNLCVQTGSGTHPASCTMGTGGSFSGVKARPGRDADHSPPSSAEVKKE